MTILAINTATSETAIALLESSSANPPANPPLLIAEKSWTSHNDEAEKLMPAIDTLLKENGKEFSDIQKVIVVRGPGSFTGLRIGVTVANTIAYLNNCEIAALDTFEYLHHQNKLPVLLFAGHGGVYFSAERNSEPRLVNLPDLSEVLKGIKEISGDISMEQKTTLGTVKFVPGEKTFGEVMIEAASEISTASKDNRIIAPLYIKQPAITQSKKQICFT